jgi:tartrate dehydrogenase/decarboxylase/D-malate dehydrogenase
MTGIDSEARGPLNADLLTLYNNGKQPLNPEHRYPSMFEPVHGSAPDIAGTNRADPIGAVWSGALMLHHLGFPDAAQRLEAAIARTVSEGRSLTPDLGGSASTIELGDALVRALT